MNKHEANNAIEQQISSEKLARHNQLMAEEAKACNAPLEQYKLGHALHVHIEAQTKAAERKKYEAEQAHHKEQQRRATIRNASVSELMNSMVAKAPLAIFSDVRAYLDTGHMPEPLKEWVIAQFDGAKS